MNVVMPVLGIGSGGLDIERFGRGNPQRTVTEGGQLWSYRCCGVAGPPLLMLTGALGRADFGYQAMEVLARECRVIAPDYPPVGSLDDLLAGLCAILDAEGIGRAHVMGGSFGGIAAQTLARERPERIASLILSHTGAPRRAPGAQAALKLLAALPEGLLRGLFRRRVRSAVAVAGPFWLAQFEEAVARLGKDDIISRTRLAAEFGRRYSGAPLAAHAAYPVLILDAADDPLIRSADRLKLRSLYPQAELSEFEGTGHLAAILRPEEFAGAIAEFIRAHAGADSRPQ